MKFKDAASVFSPGKIEIDLNNIKVLPRFGVYVYTLGRSYSYWTKHNKKLFYSFGLQDRDFYCNFLNMDTKEFKSMTADEEYYYG